MEKVELSSSDVGMPTMDGPAMVRAMRAKRPDLPVLFMSGYAEEQLLQSIDIDDVAFLPKPFPVAQLAEAVAGTLDDPAHRVPNGKYPAQSARRGRGAEGRKGVV